LAKNDDKKQIALTLKVGQIRLLTWLMKLNEKFSRSSRHFLVSLYFLTASQKEISSIHEVNFHCG